MMFFDYQFFLNLGNHKIYMKKIELQYWDAEGKPQLIQVPLRDWEKIVRNLKKQRQACRFKRVLIKGLQEVALIKDGNIPRTTFKEFLDQL